MKPLLIFISLLVFSTNAHSQEWEDVSSPPDFLSHHSFGFSIDGLGYLLTGSSGNNQTPTDGFFQYDPLLDEWTELDDFPELRSFGIGHVYDGKAYFGFGTTNTTYQNDLWEFDPGTGEWNELSSCPCQARIHPALVAVNGKVYVGMGASTNSNLNDWWEYDIETDTWEEKTGFPGAVRHHPFQFVIGDYVYAGLGHGFNIFSDFYRYDPSTDTWDEMESIPGEARVAGTQFSHGGLGYVLSGEGSDHGPMQTGELWYYNPDFDSWEELPSHPGLSRWAPASFVIDDEVYLINGMVRFFASSQFIYQQTAFKFALDSFTSVEDLTSDGQEKVYPNPATDQLIVENVESLDTGFSLTNSLGQEVNDYITSEQTETDIQLDLTALETGIYYLRIGTNVHKISKQ